MNKSKLKELIFDFWLLFLNPQLLRWLWSSLECLIRSCWITIYWFDFFWTTHNYKHATVDLHKMTDLVPYRAFPSLFVFGIRQRFLDEISEVWREISAKDRPRMLKTITKTIDAADWIRCRTVWTKIKAKLVSSIRWRSLEQHRNTLLWIAQYWWRWKPFINCLLLPADLNFKPPTLIISHIDRNQLWR